METSEENVIQYYEILDPSSFVNVDADDPLALDNTELFTNAEENDEGQQIFYYIQSDENGGTNIILTENGLDLSTDNETYEIDNTEESEVNEEIFKIITMQGGQIIMTETNNLDDIEINTEESYNNRGFREIDLDGTRAFIEESVWQLFSKKEDVDLSNNVKQKKRIIEKRRFDCRVEGCGKYYMSAANLMVHMRSHTGLKPFTCPISTCGKDFVTGYSLKTHLRCHSGEKPYPCMVCGKSFKTSGDLSKHYRTHTGERPFPCPFPDCNKRFTTSNIRKVHIRSHTGERPYTCDFENCGKSFASATNHKNHLRIHTGEKPYACKVQHCNKRFTEYSSLYKHSLVHMQQEQQHQQVNNTLDSHFAQIYTASMILSGEDGDGENDMAAILSQHPGDGENILGAMAGEDLDGLVGSVDDYMG